MSNPAIRDRCTVEYVQACVSEKLALLEELFLPRCRLSFVMRDPENDECSMLITNDTNVPAIRRVLKYLEKREEI